MAARDTASWNKAVANSEVFCRSADEGMDARKLDVVSLLLFGSKTSQDGGKQSESSKSGLNVLLEKNQFINIRNLD